MIAEDRWDIECFGITVREAFKRYQHVSRWRHLLEGFGGTCTLVKAARDKNLTGEGFDTCLLVHQDFETKEGFEVWQLMLFECEEGAFVMMEPDCSSLNKFVNVLNCQRNADNGF